MTIDRVVVVGSSVAGIRGAQALRAGGFAGDLVVVGAESAAPYDRPPLSKQLLTGDTTAADIGLLRAGDEFGLRLGTAAAGLDPAGKKVVLADGEPVGYDALIIATGVRARTLPGTDEKLVRPLRELKDAAALRARLADGAPVVVIGWPKGSVTTRLAWQRGAEVADVRAALAKLSDRVAPFDLAAQKGN